jgi:hypothetical protein
MKTQPDRSTRTREIAWRILSLKPPGERKVRWLRKCAHIQSGCLYNWERGWNYPSDEKLNEIAGALGVSREWLEFGERGRNG